jgi:hypothetical protein
VANPRRAPADRVTSQGERPAFKVVVASEDELARHQGRLRAIAEKSGHCLWQELAD